MLIDELDSLGRGLGPYSRHELLQAFSRNGLAGMLRREELVRVLPDLYAATAHAESTFVRARAAQTWSPPGGALTGRAALEAWRVPYTGGGPVGLVVPRGRHRAIAPWLRVTSQTLPFERRRALLGVTAVQPELALIHAAQWEPWTTRQDLIYRACASPMIHVERAQALLEQLPRVRERRGLASMLAHAADGVESYLEERGAVTILTGAEFDDVVRQHWIRVAGERFRVDGYHHPTRTVFEFDGDGAHSSREAQREDRLRDALLATLGILTVRFSYRDVVDRPRWCRKVAIQVLQARACEVSLAA